jgi:hypothetical protein
VRRDVIAQHLRELVRIERDDAGRKLPHRVTREQIVDRLVDGAPLVDEIAEALAEQRRVLAKLLDDLRPTIGSEAAQVHARRSGRTPDLAWVSDPDRIREVMHGDERPDPERA